MKSGTDHIGVGVCYFCHDGAGNIVMSKRNQNARDEKGRWDIGGGAVEFGSTAEETLRKEIKEEYSTDVVDFEFIGFRDVLREYEGQPTHWLMLDYKVLVDKDLVANGEPHKFDDVTWFTLESMPKEIHSQLKIFLEKYKNELF
ncbi:MAG: NUDIX domain-containing protein [Candidatus Magasanikbacteria bacterium]|nr:NUDIX domain-containing protein [Candidatus Magasanikbacteria bacterium]